MSHIQQLNFVSSLAFRYPKHFTNCEVLEVGSLNINGSIRQFFLECNYIGIDVGPGPGVDLVCEGQKYDGDDGSFKTVISCECFEHNPHWVETFSNMHRVCEDNGLIIMTCATTGRREHGTFTCGPNDSPLTVAKGWNYYRNLTEYDFLEAFDLDSMFSSYCFSVDSKAHDLYFYGFKKSK